MHCSDSFFAYGSSVVERDSAGLGWHPLHSTFDHFLDPIHHIPHYSSPTIEGDERDKHSRTSIYSDHSGSCFGSQTDETEVSDTRIGNSTDCGSDHESVCTPKSSVKGVDIFVGGLPRSTNNEMLQEWFKRVAKPIEVRVARDKRRKRCRGYGYVKFSTSEEADRVIEIMRNFQFKRGCFLGILPCDENRTIYINGLNENWQKDEVTAFFTDMFSDIKSLQLVWEREDPTKLRPFCFIEFNCHKSALQAYRSYSCEARNGSSVDEPDISSEAVNLMFNDTHLKVEWADPLRYFIHLYGGVNRHTMSISTTKKLSLQHKGPINVNRNIGKNNVLSSTNGDMMKRRTNHLHEVPNSHYVQQSEPYRVDATRNSHFKQLSSLNIPLHSYQCSGYASTFTDDQHFRSHVLGRRDQVQQRLRDLQFEALRVWSMEREFDSNSFQNGAPKFMEMYHTHNWNLNPMSSQKLGFPAHVENDFSPRIIGYATPSHHTPAAAKSLSYRSNTPLYPAYSSFPAELGKQSMYNMHGDNTYIELCQSIEKLL